jgi:hypothetical protein
MYCVVRRYAESERFDVRETSLPVGREASASSGDDDDSQVGAIVPNRIGKISAESIDQDLVLVEF